MLEPYPYQRETIDIATRRNYLCADDCGVGKTLVGIETAREVQRIHPHPVLIICVNDARLQWADSIYTQDENLDIKLVRSTGEFAEISGGTHSLDWFIMHHAAFRKLKKDDPIYGTYFSSIILDEAHRIKGRNSQQTRGIKRLLSKRKLALTATDMESSPADLWSILNWLYPERFPGYHGFYAKYVEEEIHPFFGWKKAVGVKNPEKLAAELEGIYCKRTKQEVRDDMPPLTETRYVLDMNPRLRRGYRQIQTAGDIVVELEDTEFIIPNVLARIMTLRQLMSNGLKLYTSDKIRWVESYVADNPNENIILFSAFRDTAIMLAKKLQAPLVIGGQETPDLQGTKPRLIVGTIKAMGESLDLPWIDTAVFVDCEWSSILMHQARERIYRINIESPKHVIYLYHKGTVDELVFDALDKKWDNIRIVQQYLEQYAP